MNEVYFDIPYSSFKKDFLDTYSDELTENLFLHLLPYIIAQPQELNLYKMLISFDIKDSILYGLSDDIKARFLSASAQHKKSMHQKNLLIIFGFISEIMIQKTVIKFILRNILHTKNIAD